MLYSLFAYDNSGEPCLPPLLRLPLLHSLHVLQVAILSSVLHYFSSVHVLHVTILSSVLHYFSSVHVLLCYALFKLPFSHVPCIVFHQSTSSTVELFMFSELNSLQWLPFVFHQSVSSTVTLSSCSPSCHSLQWLSLFPISPCHPLLHSFHVLQVTAVSSGFHYFPSDHGFRCYILCMFLKLPFAPVASILSPQSSSSTVTLRSCSPSYHAFRTSHCYSSFYGFLLFLLPLS